MSEPIFRGLIPAFPTPIKADGTIDEVALERVVSYQIERGASGLVPVGGTGEATAFSIGQRKRIVEITVAVASQRVPVIAGVLDPGFGGALESAALYQSAGADGLMIIPPYYTRTDQEGVLRYFRALAPKLALPVIYYDNPYRSHLVSAPETIAQMAEEGLIVGMKASNTDLYHLDRLTKLLPEHFSLLSGQDTLFVQQVALGAKGGVLTSAALLPDYWAKVQALAEAGEIRQALAMQGRLNPLMDALFAEQFPEAVKRAFDRLGIRMGGSLPPVTDLSEGAQQNLAAALDDLITAGILRPVT
jgi:4-hydroxy-tetrahydrodipicolinate synthase